MSFTAASLLVDIAQGYFAAGLVFATVFLWRWVGRLDPLAAAGTLGFRLLVLPGVAAFWPLFAVRLHRGASSPPDEWTAHRASARRSLSSTEGRR